MPDIRYTFVLGFSLVIFITSLIGDPLIFLILLIYLIHNEYLSEIKDIIKNKIDHFNDSSILNQELQLKIKKSKKPEEQVWNRFFYLKVVVFIKMKIS